MKRKDFVNKNVGILRNQDHRVDTFKSFCDKSGLRKLFWGHITEYTIDLSLREQVPLNLFWYFESLLKPAGVYAI